MDNNKKNNKETRFWRAETIAFVCVMLFSWVFFARRGDTPVHIKWGEEMLMVEGSFFDKLKGVFLIKAFPLWHLLIQFVARIAAGTLGLFGIAKDDLIFGYDMFDLCESSAAALLTAAFITLTVYVTYRVMEYHLKGRLSNRQTLHFAMSMAVCGAIFIYGMYKTPYPIGCITPNVWHNTTQIAVEPFAVASFFLYLYAYDNRTALSAQTWRWKLSRYDCCMILFSVLMFVGALLKPSFFQAFVPGLFVFCAVDVFSTRFKSLKFNLLTAAALLPLGALGLLQFLSTFVDNESTLSGGLAAGWLYVWHVFSDVPLVSLLLSAAFPLFVFAVLWRKIPGNSGIRLSLLTFVSGVGQYAVLYIKDAPFCADFIWGANISLRLLFIVAFIELIRAQDEMGCTKYRIGLGIFALHILSGLGFFLYFLAKAGWELM
ncbi:MAG: hypothetical protein RR998_05625 [Oscillospiraceae bacterium]